MRTDKGETHSIEGFDVYVMPEDASPDRWCARGSWIFFALRTRSGVVGWGESYGFGSRSGAIAAMLRQLGNFIVGMDAMARRSTDNAILGSFAHQIHGPELYASLSAIDGALWDVAGKILGASVGSLTGNAQPAKVACYASLWSHRPQSIERTARVAAEFMELGYPCVKLYPMYHDSDMGAAVDMILAVRDAIGDGQLILDFSRLRRPDEVLAIMRAVADQVSWVEDPLPLDNLETLADLNRELGFRVITGETECGVRNFNRLLRAQAAAGVSPDVAFCGGISELVRVADLTETYNVALVPHCYGSPVSTVATAYAVSACPQLVYAEVFPGLLEDGCQVATNFTPPVQGKLTCNGLPGLGLEINEAFLNQYRLPA